MNSLLMSLDFERALRLSASGHRDQVRKGSGVPYVEHPMAVALILDRAGFPESVVIAGLLHDLVEDTDVTLDEIRVMFGDRVGDLVGHGSEVKLDERGEKRPWRDRKRDHVAAIAQAPDDAKAVVLADKLHKLVCIRLDLVEGRPVWETFNAGREMVLGYYAEMLEACRSDDVRLIAIDLECRRLLAEVSSVEEKPKSEDATG